MSEGAIAPYAQAFRNTQIQPTYAPAPLARPPSVWDTYRQVLAPQVQAPSQFQSAITGVRHGLESAAVGALLGAIHGKFGTLDIAGKYPADGIAALLLMFLSVKNAGEPDGYASDLRAMSQSCTTIASFRMADKWASGGKKPDSEPKADMSRHTAAGSGDPLVAAAKKYGL